MERPLELSFRGMEKSEALESLVRKKVDRLEKFYDRITGCRVAIERPHRHESSGNPYRVRIDITAPRGHEIVVVKDPGDGELSQPIATMINRAFEAAERELKELKERQRQEVKTHPEARALVVRMAEEDGYGFLKTPDGREIYFHRNSVADGKFGRLTVGSEVRFEEEMGEDGPQATTVHLVAKPGSRARSDGEKPVRPPLGWRQRD